MAKVQIWVEVSEEHFHRYEGEARRRGVPVETLVAHTVNCLLKEFEDEERECPDRLLLMSWRSPEGVASRKEPAVLRG
jgi:hypothetical protein